MRRFFSKISPSSRADAKNRLKSVIKNDRMNVSNNKTLEKMREEVSAVLAKYASKASVPPQVSVTCQQGQLCVLAATVTIEKENYIR